MREPPLPTECAYKQSCASENLELGNSSTTFFSCSRNKKRVKTERVVRKGEETENSLKRETLRKSSK